ncbi:MAG: hypothetical protein AAF617_13915 [Bacteroidota bacterium]
MKVLKIILIICSLIVIGGVFYIIWIDLSRISLRRTPYYLYINLGLALVFSVANIIYHIKSFRFYRSKEKWQLDKKVSKILWAGVICFSCFLLYLGSVTLYSVLQFMRYGFYTRAMLTVLIFIIPGFLGFLEASLLKKRIRRLRSETNTIDEIDTIGKEVE